MQANQQLKTPKQFVVAILWMTLGAFVAAFSLEVILLPNEIIDGGVVGISILIDKMFHYHNILYPLVIILNLPFIYLAAKYISRLLVIQMIIAIFIFAAMGTFIEHNQQISMFQPYKGELLEVVVVGGILLGFGIGLILKVGGCLDGTEILGLIINKRFGMSVGNVVLCANAIIFTISGFIFGDWHPPIQSLITFFIVIKVMDMVIMGVDEMKSVMIFTSKPREIADIILHDMGLGLTFLQGKGGYSGEDKQIIFLMAERLQLADLKVLVANKDPEAFIAIENLHEVATNNLAGIAKKGR